MSCLLALHLPAGGLPGVPPLLVPDGGITIAGVAGFLTAISAYWVAAALALFLFAIRRRPGMLNTLITVAIAWLILRAVGAILGLLVPCLAPDAESSFGFVVAVILSYLLPLRLWQRVLCLSIVGLMAATRAFALHCQMPGELALAAGAVALAALIVWALGRWPPVRQLWQRLALALDNWSARQSRVELRPPVRAVLAARLRRHLGFTVETFEPVGAPGVHASTPVVLAGRTRDGQPRRYFVKIVSRQNWQTSVTYELLHWLQYRGRLRRGPVWTSLKALVEYEHYMLLLFTDLGVPVPRPRGIYRLQREMYALVSDYLEGIQPLRGAGQVSSGYVEQAFRVLRRMREADCVHCDLKASNVVILPGETFALVDLALAECVAGPRRLARDLADLLAILAMHHEPEEVVAIAREVIGGEGLRHARAYLHRSLLNEETQKLIPLDLPGRLRALISTPPRRA